jgi:two-component system, NtrC family, sensor kinase
MTRKAGELFRLLQDYAAVAIILAVAFALGFAGRIFWALPLLVVSCLIFLNTRSLRLRLRDAARQKTLLDGQLLQSQKLASVGELSAGIAHEINNPLAIIAQEAEWIRHLSKDSDQGEGTAREELLDSLREITIQVDRCKEITSNLLNFARKMEPVFQAVDVNKLIDDMVRLVEKEASLNGIQLVRAYQQDLPVLHTDPPGLRQVVLNLLNNAKHAIERDGTITVSTRAPDQFVDILVSDTGCGIPKDHLGKIFDPFFSTKPQGKGTGLGLSICHGIIDRLSGTIAVSSEVGKGATFTVRLPSNKRKDDRHAP